MYKVILNFIFELLSFLVNFLYIKQTKNRWSDCEVVLLTALCTS